MLTKSSEELKDVLGKAEAQRPAERVVGLLRVAVFFLNVVLGWRPFCFFKGGLFSAFLNCVWLFLGVLADRILGSQWVPGMGSQMFPGSFGAREICRFEAKGGRCVVYIIGFK